MKFDKKLPIKVILIVNPQRVQYYAYLLEQPRPKTFPENWDSKATSVGTLLVYLETTA